MLSKKAQEIYDEAYVKLDGDMDPLHFSFAHIVWEDFNLKDNHIIMCIDYFGKNGSDLTPYHNYVVMESLIKLSQIPENEREE